jgi:hypothetical protein
MKCHKEDCERAFCRTAGTAVGNRLSVRGAAGTVHAEGRLVTWVKGDLEFVVVIGNSERCEGIIIA